VGEIARRAKVNQALIYFLEELMEGMIKEIVDLKDSFAMNPPDLDSR
jgi:hypothetical protein